MTISEAIKRAIVIPVTMVTAVKTRAAIQTHAKMVARVIHIPTTSRAPVQLVTTVLCVSILAQLGSMVKTVSINACVARMVPAILPLVIVPVRGVTSV